MPPDPLIALGARRLYLSDLPEYLITEAQQYEESCCVTGADLSPLETLGCAVLRAIERQRAPREG